VALKLTKRLRALGEPVIMLDADELRKPCLVAGSPPSVIVYAVPEFSWGQARSINAQDLSRKEIARVLDLAMEPDPLQKGKTTIPFCMPTWSFATAMVKS
jgi:hypothetical protein